MAEGATGGPDLPHMSSWATAIVIIIMVLLSGFIESVIDMFTRWFHGPHRRWFTLLKETLEKIKEEFMLLGFMSLLLNLLETPISNICVAGKAGNIILPRKHADYEAARGDPCREKGKVALTSPNSMHQLHMLMLVCFVVHLIYSFAAMTLARFRIKSWKKWEPPAGREEPVVTNAAAGQSGPNGPETWIMGFFRQFCRPAKLDYEIMRQHFINRNIKPQNYDFHTYIMRLFQNDGKVFMAISPAFWVVAILTVLLNIHGWGTLFWMSFVPLIILLVLGAKLVKVYTDMEFVGTDPSFWFNYPGFIRFLIRLVQFENAFLTGHFLWAMGSSGLKNYYYKNLFFGIMGAVFGIAFQIICGLVTFPLYAIVLRMAKVEAVENRNANRNDDNRTNDRADGEAEASLE